MPIQGGPGGSYFRSECSAAKYVIGIEIRHGSWVDAIRLICAGYTSASRIPPDVELPFQGQQGGTLTNAKAICPSDSFVTGIKFGTTRDGDDPRYVDYVELTCSSISVWGIPPLAVFGQMGTFVCLPTGEGCWNQHPTASSLHPFGQSCDLGDAATGIHGRSGIYVDALGLICGASPPLVAATAQAPAGSGTTPPQLTPDQIAYRDAHNAHRAKHCVPNLTVSLDLESTAQAWANGCKHHFDSEGEVVFDHDDLQSTDGENLYWSRANGAKEAVDAWYDEITRYDFDNPIDSYNAGVVDHNKEVRHFTQVVWKASKEVGCAKAACVSQVLWVCRYSPPGNFNATDPGVLDANVPRPSPGRCPK